MEGWKTKLGGILLIFAGAGGMAATWLGFPGLSWDVGLTLLGAGFAALGLGHKFDKLKQALEAVRPGAKAGILIVLMGAVLAGCASLPAVVGALAKDTATICAKFATIYGGTMEVARTNITNGDVTCYGLTVKSQATQIGVPMVVTPQLSIGQPVLSPRP